MDVEVNFCPVCGSSNIKSYKENEGNGCIRRWHTGKCEDCKSEFEVSDGYFDESIYKYNR